MNGAQIVQTWSGVPCSYPREILNIATRLGLIIKDTTWGNDACPSFLIVRPRSHVFPSDTPLLKVYHDTDDPEQRETMSGVKFQAVLITADEDEDYDTLYEVETDWEIISAVRQLLRLAGIPVGYGGAS